MQLYTVKLRQLKLISVFNKKGEKIEEKEEQVEVTFADLPLATAQMYRQTSAAGQVDVIRQDMTAFGKNKTRVSFDRKRYADPKPAAKTRAAPPKASGPSALQTAAATGNLAAAINQGS